ncbi:MAG: FtsQ-type POTRA domain-containing protein, partial [Eubacteriales bacterium]|nr:FtsQ-type POTRA domain-containing protein [Eubacteriales bacterium]
MKKKYTYIILGIAIFIFIILILMLSPWLNIKQIEINGLKRLEENQIIREVGLDKETNLLAFNTLKAKASLKKNYYIKDVKIKKVFPDKIIFEINERELAGYIPYIDHYLYIDKNGFIVDIKHNYTEKLPLITGLKFDKFILGETLDIEDKDAFNVV